MQKRLNKLLHFPQRKPMAMSRIEEPQVAQCHWHKKGNFQIRLADAKDKTNMKEYK